MLPEYYEFQNSTKILSGKNAIENIPFELENLNVSRPLILTGAVLTKIGVVKMLTDALKCGGVEIAGMFCSIPADSSVYVINEIAGLYRQLRCDGIVALGGGSVLDTAKGVTMVISQGASDIMELEGNEILKKGIHVPFVAVPTTAGTGSEVTLAAVVSNSKKNVKMEFISYNMLPDVAVLDARTTETLPPKMTASTGFDAMCHAIEAYTCKQKNPMSDAYALSALGLIGKYLKRAVGNGSDTEARLAMANGSLMAGTAFSNSMVGMVHAVGHALGGVCHVPHGDAMAVLLPHCMDFNMDVCGNLYGELLLWIGGAEEFAAVSKDKRGVKTLEHIHKLAFDFNRLCGLPMKLRDVGVKKEDFEEIAYKAMNDGAIVLNPKYVSYEDITDILKKAF